MRFRLRTLMIVLVLGPPLLALAWFYAPGPSEMTGWIGITGLFALAHWLFCRSLERDTAKRGSSEYPIYPPPPGT